MPHVLPTNYLTKNPSLSESSSPKPAKQEEASYNLFAHILDHKTHYSANALYSQPSPALSSGFGALQDHFIEQNESAEKEKKSADSEMLYALHTPTSVLEAPKDRWQEGLSDIRSETHAQHLSASSTGPAHHLGPERTEAKASSASEGSACAAEMGEQLKENRRNDAQSASSGNAGEDGVEAAQYSGSAKSSTPLASYSGRGENFAAQPFDSTSTQPGNAQWGWMSRMGNSGFAGGQSGQSQFSSSNGYRFGLGGDSIQPLGAMANGETLAFEEVLSLKSEGLMGLEAAFGAGREGIRTMGSTYGLRTPLGKAQWAENLGERIEWLVTQKIHKATILVNPAKLGPIEVSLSMEGGKTHATFVSSNAQVREAIEASLPTLERMLENAGIALGNTGVFDQAKNAPQSANEQHRFADHSDETENLHAKASEVSQYMTSLQAEVNTSDLFAKTLRWVDTFV